MRHRFSWPMRIVAPILFPLALPKGLIAFLLAPPSNFVFAGAAIMFAKVLFRKKEKKKKNYQINFFWGGEGLTNEKCWTDHVIWGPIKGVKKNCMGRGQIYIHIYMDIASTRQNQPSGPIWWKLQCHNFVISNFGKFTVL